MIEIARQWRHYGDAIENVPIDTILGYDYGDPDHEETHDVSTGTTNGNYRKIKNEFLLPFLKNKTIMEVGTFDGKWIQFFKDADKIICVDLFDNGFTRMRERWKWSNLFFYKTEGRELKGIDSESVDIIFSIDSLVRTDKDALKDYFKEFKRVLKKDGKMCIHLPCTCSAKSLIKGFTDLTEDEIIAYCNEFKIENYKINKNTITHGVLLLVNYDQTT